MRTRERGILLLEDILSLTEEILSCSKITVNDREKDIHREIKEAFQLKTKTELLVSALSMVYSLIIEVETEAESQRLWKEAPEIAPQISQKKKNRIKLLKYLETI